MELIWQRHGDGHHYTTRRGELEAEVIGGLGLPTRPVAQIRILDSQGKQMRIKRCEVPGRDAAFAEADAMLAAEQRKRDDRKAARHAKRFEPATETAE